MAVRNRLQVVRDIFGAYESGDRGATYFERCRPASETIVAYEFPRLAEAGEEVVVTYDATRTEGPRFRNTEIFGFDGDKVNRVEVYFGWNLD